MQLLCHFLGFSRPAIPEMLLPPFLFSFFVVIDRRSLVNKMRMTWIHPFHRMMCRFNIKFSLFCVYHTCLYFTLKNFAPFSHQLTSPLQAETATLEFGWPWTMPWKWHFLDLSLGFDRVCVSLFLRSMTRAGARKFDAGSRTRRCSLSWTLTLKCTGPSSKLVRSWEMYSPPGPTFRGMVSWTCDKKPV